MLILHSESNPLGSSPFRTWKNTTFIQFGKIKAGKVLISFGTVRNIYTCLYPNST
ncbi:hypothetical protein M125_3816 [Bacteroides fragilis str. 3998T(B)3]|uniref:Uncharacterized protein n=1 Tax=Bacteroides fragilis str. 3998T(B)3 TaxID=1339316 RepID=A0A015U3Y1_BACFG|nr:hypothetical protein M125_3816 [Bacteroides fragilis str. 3998T(B)3]